MFAAILGFHGMLNQVQYHKAFVSGEREVTSGTESGSGFRGKHLMIKSHHRVKSSNSK